MMLYRFAHCISTMIAPRRGAYFFTFSPTPTPRCGVNHDNASPRHHPPITPRRDAPQCGTRGAGFPYVHYPLRWTRYIASLLGLRLQANVPVKKAAPPREERRSLLCLTTIRYPRVYSPRMNDIYRLMPSLLLLADCKITVKVLGCIPIFYCANCE